MARGGKSMATTWEVHDTGMARTWEVHGKGMASAWQDDSRSLSMTCLYDDSLRRCCARSAIDSAEARRPRRRAGVEELAAA